MSRKKTGLIFICSFIFSLNLSAQNKLSQYVNPIIGSDAHGHVFVGANVPFGAVQLGPTNIFEGWDWCSGYHYSSNTIVGFTHTHLSGTGIGDLNDVLIMPATGKVQLDKGTKTDQKNGYVSTFSHANEVAKPGYYSVILDKYKIKAELTASERVGFHRYTFPAKQDNPHVMLDLSDGIGWDKPVETYIKQVNSTTLVGYRLSTGWAKDQRLYFAVKLSQPLSSMSLYDSTQVAKGIEGKGRKMKAVLNFKAIEKNVLQMKVGISPVSYENALANIAAEIPAWDFAKVVASADAKWNKELAKIQIEGSKETKKVFYTALYHTMIAPTLFNDANGDYRGTDKKVYHKPGFDNYTTFSLWDTYRAFHPLYTIIHPDKVSDIISSFLAIYKQQGKLPVWHLMGNETNTMIGYHAVPIIVDAYLKGYRKYDVELAYEAIKHSAMQKEDGIEYAQKLKYIPADKVNEAVAKGLEYAIDDWCIARMAKAMHKEEDYVYFSKRAKLYAEYFDPQVEFMRGKLADGSWRKPFDPVASKHREDDYTEGNAWQYTWLVPQDPEGLIHLFGGEAGFTRKLDSLFSISSVVEAGGSPDISGLIGQYAQGNEPNHHTPYMYAYAGKPWKTAQVVRQITDSLYTAKPDGLCGNEDLGQMSSWYVFSALGFYPVNPANGAYVFGSPLVDHAIINLPGAKKFELKVIGNSPKNKYIQKAVLNGKPYTKNFLLHAAIVAGGELTLYMGDQPSATWGVSLADRPKSAGAE
ncbi:putative alpha-1,2-mannosidase [Pedobacter cryoconitis]|uniref:Putative alpha-1,2-mannosidase n=1 Tax=Pedobacter cryoconitis TaxID=188932 RepID=A0A7W8YR50_9SPHI|nr:GH92 family glycosyl hydrolase [Pedobacter cryoconitis]MBB5619980.1 putative alpha-1,2-mannosidase [Pedobacter cryoconitis]MBB5648123.1 putative alpha-1,2-mannosidase [Pedobacter cryoconitis]